MKNKLLLILTLYLSNVYCSYGQEYSTFLDPRDGQSYKTVKIGDQIWMAENLRYQTGSGSWCYNNNDCNCIPKGRYYNWKTANEVCPWGWRLPSKSDYETLLVNLKILPKYHYEDLLLGGSSGFNAILTGFCNKKGVFRNFGVYGAWWSSSESSMQGSYYLLLSSRSEKAKIRNFSRKSGLSVRCIK